MTTTVIPDRAAAAAPAEGVLAVERDRTTKTRTTRGSAMVLKMGTIPVKRETIRITLAKGTNNRLTKEESLQRGEIPAFFDFRFCDIIKQLKEKKRRKSLAVA